MLCDKKTVVGFVSFCSAVHILSKHGDLAKFLNITLKIYVPVKQGVIYINSIFVDSNPKYNDIVVGLYFNDGWQCIMKKKFKLMVNKYQLLLYFV